MGYEGTASKKAPASPASSLSKQFLELRSAKDERRFELMAQLFTGGKAQLNISNASAFLQQYAPTVLKGFEAMEANVTKQARAFTGKDRGAWLASQLASIHCDLITAAGLVAVLGKDVGEYIGRFNRLMGLEFRAEKDNKAKFMFAAAYLTRGLGLDLNSVLYVAAHPSTENDADKRAALAQAKELLELEKGGKGTSDMFNRLRAQVASCWVPKKEPAVAGFTKPASVPGAMDDAQLAKKVWDFFFDDSKMGHSRLNGSGLGGDTGLAGKSLEKLENLPAMKWLAEKKENAALNGLCADIRGTFLRRQEAEVNDSFARAFAGGRLEDVKSSETFFKLMAVDTTGGSDGYLRGASVLYGTLKDMGDRAYKTVNKFTSLTSAKDLDFIRAALSLGDQSMCDWIYEKMFANVLEGWRGIRSAKTAGELVLPEGDSVPAQSLLAGGQDAEKNAKEALAAPTIWGNISVEGSAYAYNALRHAEVALSAFDKQVDNTIAGLRANETAAVQIIAMYQNAGAELLGPYKDTELKNLDRFEEARNLSQLQISYQLNQWVNNEWVKKKGIVAPVGYDTTLQHMQTHANQLQGILQKAGKSVSTRDALYLLLSKNADLAGQTESPVKFAKEGRDSPNPKLRFLLSKVSSAMHEEWCPYERERISAQLVYPSSRGASPSDYDANVKTQVLDRLVPAEAGKQEEKQVSAVFTIEPSVEIKTVKLQNAPFTLNAGETVSRLTIPIAQVGGDGFDPQAELGLSKVNENPIVTAIITSKFDDTEKVITVKFHTEVISLEKDEIAGNPAGYYLAYTVDENEAEKLKKLIPGTYSVTFPVDTNLQLRVNTGVNWSITTKTEPANLGARLGRIRDQTLSIDDSIPISLEPMAHESNASGTALLSSGFHAIVSSANIGRADISPETTVPGKIGTSIYAPKVYATPELVVTTAKMPARAPVERLAQVVFQLAPVEVGGRTMVISPVGIVLSREGGTVTTPTVNAFIGVSTGAFPPSQIGNFQNALESDTPGKDTANVFSDQSVQTNMVDPASGALNAGSLAATNYKAFTAQLAGAKDIRQVLTILDDNLNFINAGLGTWTAEGSNVLVTVRQSTQDAQVYTVNVHRFKKAALRVGIEYFTSTTKISTTVLNADGSISTLSEEAKKSKISPAVLLTYAISQNSALQASVSEHLRDLKYVITPNEGRTMYFVGCGFGEVNAGAVVGVSQQVAIVKGIPLSIQLSYIGGVQPEVRVGGQPILNLRTMDLSTYGAVFSLIDVGVAFLRKKEVSKKPSEERAADELMRLNEPKLFNKTKLGDAVVTYDSEQLRIRRGCILAQMVLGNSGLANEYFAKALATAKMVEKVDLVSQGVTVHADLGSLVFSALKLAYDTNFNRQLSPAQKEQVIQFLDYVKSLKDAKGNATYLAQTVMFYEKAAKAGNMGGISGAKDALSATKQQSTSDIALGGRERIAGQLGPDAEGVYLILGNEAAKAYNKLVMAEIAAPTKAPQALPTSATTAPVITLQSEATSTTVEGTPSVASPMMQFTPLAQPVDKLLENYVKLSDAPHDIAKKADILASVVLQFNSLGAAEPDLGSNMIMMGMSAAVHDNKSADVLVGEGVTSLTISPAVAKAAAERLNTLNREDPRIKPDLAQLDGIILKK